MYVSRLFVVLALSCSGGCAAADKVALALAPDQLLSLSPVQQDRAAKPRLDARLKGKKTTLPKQPVTASLPEAVWPQWTIPAQRPAKVLRYSLPPSDLFKRVSPSVYTVATAGSQGSAVAISLKELVTACHVVSRGGPVTLSKGASTLKADVVGADPSTDRCFLRIQDGELVPVPGFRDYSTLAVGETVYTLGSPKRPIM